MATEQPNPSLVLSDGSLAFKINRRDGTTLDVSMDLLVLKLCCEQCEDDHHLPVKDGTIRPTAEFLTDLAKRLGAYVENCTPSVAWQLWLASIEQMEQLKKTTNVTPSSLSGSESTQEPSPEQKESDGSPISNG